jgi:predicted DNA-binding transcriptional regulator AlpA
MNSDILNAKEAAALAGISEGLLRKLVAKGDFPSRYISSIPGRTKGKGGLRQFSRAEIYEWLAQKSRQSQQALLPRLPQVADVDRFGVTNRQANAFDRLKREITSLFPHFRVHDDGTLETP